MNVETLICSEVADLLKDPPDHCISCHDDLEDYGYEMLWVSLGDGHEGEVCCAVRRAVREQNITVQGEDE